MVIEWLRGGYKVVTWLLGGCGLFKRLLQGGYRVVTGWLWRGYVMVTRVTMVTIVKVNMLKRPARRAKKLVRRVTN